MRAGASEDDGAPAGVFGALREEDALVVEPRIVCELSPMMSKLSTILVMSRLALWSSIVMDEPRERPPSLSIERAGRSRFIGPPFPSTSGTSAELNICHVASRFTVHHPLTLLSTKMRRSSPSRLAKKKADSPPLLLSLATRRVIIARCGSSFAHSASSRSTSAWKERFSS